MRIVSNAIYISDIIDSITVTKWVSCMKISLFQIKYNLVGTDKFKVDPDTGDVTLNRPLDREVRQYTHVKFGSF